MLSSIALGADTDLVDTMVKEKEIFGIFRKRFPRKEVVIDALLKFVLHAQALSIVDIIKELKFEIFQIPFTWPVPYIVRGSWCWG